MKNSILIFFMAGLFAACSDQPKSNTSLSKDVVTTDTAGLYTDQNRVMHLNGVNGTTVTTVTTTTITKSGNTQPAAVAQTQAPKKAVRHTSSGTTARRSQNSGGTYSSGSGTASQPTAQTTQKKGWSKAAKGAVIGAGSGAVVGAIISKKKGKGAIIGGVLGAGAGYGIGRAKDKKDGRY